MYRNQNQQTLVNTLRKQNMDYKPVLHNTASEIIELSLKKQTDSYYQSFWKSQAWRVEETLANLVTHLESKRKLIVDIGCNPPILLASIKNLGYQTIGLDINPDSFREYIEQFNLSTVKCDIDNQMLPFEDNSVDAIVLAEVFEHLRINPLFTLSETYRVLRPGGFLLLSTPNLHSLKGIKNFLLKGNNYSCASNIFKEFNKINTIGYFGHIREYTWQEMNSLLQEIGYVEQNNIFSGGATKNPSLAPIYSLIPTLRPVLHILAFKPSPEKP
ncbi:MAG: hypothetical protein BRC41_19540 [Cyanobacteria bacterium QH_9_48_43]|nr:MAG: hypothetical protein BRC41_19540 [Cyanobacteria bacterium QH_9_48_43]